jgi:hypothetical protein
MCALALGSLTAFNPAARAPRADRDDGAVLKDAPESFSFTFESNAPHGCLCASALRRSAPHWLSAGGSARCVQHRQRTAPLRAQTAYWSGSARTASWQR